MVELGNIDTGNHLKSMQTAHSRLTMSEITTARTPLSPECPTRVSDFPVTYRNMQKFRYGEAAVFLLMEWSMQMAVGILLAALCTTYAVLHFTKSKESSQPTSAEFWRFQTHYLIIFLLMMGTMLLTSPRL